MNLSDNEVALDKLLRKNVVLIHNVLIDSARELENEIKDHPDVESAKALKGYATFHLKLAAEIYDLNIAIMDEKMKENQHE